MRLAIVTENFLPKLDGVTRTLAMLLEHAQRHGHQAIVIGPEGAPERYADAPIYTARGIPLPMYPELRALFPAPRLERIVADFRPDVIHVADPMLLAAAGVTWGRRLGVPVVASYHTNLAAYCDYFRLGLLKEPVWAYRRLLHNQCSVTLCPSRSTAHELMRRSFKNVAVWPRAVDSFLFNPQRRSEAWRARIAGDAARPIFLYVGRLSHEKNLDALVGAFTSLESQDAHLVLVGDGPARSGLQRALEGRSATFTGYLSGEALAEAFASADVFVFPSVTETFGQVVLEAMASSLCVVAYDAEGVCDTVRHGETGILVRAHTPAALSHALRMLLNSPEERRLLGVRARTAAVERTWEHVMRQLFDVYRDVLAAQDKAQAA